MSDTLWQVEHHDGGIVVAAYGNQPMGYFCSQGAEELAGLVAKWADPAVRALVLCGAEPGRFLTHYSVEELLEVAEDRDALPEVCPQVTAGYHALLEEMRALPKPVIVAMTGDTMGGGLELSMAADLRIAQDGPYRIGLLVIKGGDLQRAGNERLLTGPGPQLLERAIGRNRALDFHLRIRYVSSEGTLAFGIVNETMSPSRSTSDSTGSGNMAPGRSRVRPPVADGSAAHHPREPQRHP